MKWADSVRYLGIHIDRQFKFSKQANYVATKVKLIWAILYLVINSKSTLYINTMLYIYKTYIRRILTYTSTAWISNISDSYWKNLETVQTLSLKQILGTPSFFNNQAIKNSTKILSQRNRTTQRKKLTDQTDFHYTNILPTSSTD